MAVTASLLLLAACGAPASSTGQSGPAQIGVTGVPGGLLSLPVFVGMDRGFFKAEGLDVKFVPIHNGTETAQNLISGQALVGLTSPDSILTSREQGGSLKIVCGSTRHGTHSLIVRNQWQLPHLGQYPAVMADLKGAKIGVTARGSAQEIWVSTMLRDAGIDPKDVTFVGIGDPQTAVQSLEHGQIDALLSEEPGRSIAIHKLKIARIAVDLRADGEGPGILQNLSPQVYASTGQAIKNHSDQLKKFVAALTKTIAWMNDSANRPDLEAVTAKNIAIDKELIPQLLDGILKSFGTTVPRRNIEDSITIDMKAKVISEPVTYEDIVATQLVPAS